ncbi:MAG: hypothetical protein NC388_09335 [Clostridium sp.]|nr:hypothetical protein [Clostridium sp.]
MIKSKQDLNEYLLADGKNYPCQLGGVVKALIYRRIDTPIRDQWYIWRYVKALRMVEYHLNNASLWHRAMHKYWLFKLRHYSYKTGFQIEPNTCGKGLCIYHYGYIIVNGQARIGENCILTPGVVVGQTNKGCVPTIGNNVTLCTGAKIVGKVYVGNNAIVAPNTVVIKDVPDNATVSGVPAKIIRQR